LITYGRGPSVTSHSDEDLAPRGAAKFFFQRQMELYDYFNKELIPRERLKVLVREISLSLWYFFGYLLSSLSVRFFAVQALAQSPDVPKFLGMSPCDWSLAMHVFEFCVIILILAACFVHIIFSKRTNQWVWRTATFLLGFMTKSLSSFI
jgi:hypothetical protein